MRIEVGYRGVRFSGIALRFSPSWIISATSSPPYIGPRLSPSKMRRLRLLSPWIRKDWGPMPLSKTSMWMARSPPSTTECPVCLRAFFRWPMANLTMESSDWERAETVGFPNGGYYTKEWSNTIELRSWHGSYQRTNSAQYFPGFWSKNIDEHWCQALFPVLNDLKYELQTAL